MTQLVIRAKEIAPKKRTIKASTATTTTITSVTNAQLKALINKGIADALAAHDVDRSMNSDDSHNSGTGVRRNERLVRECTYPDFMKCQPLNFKGMEGVFELTKWTVGHDVGHAITWVDMKKKMTDKYCPRGGIKKLEVELWNLKLKGTDVIGYNQRFQELALLCVRIFPEESDKIERYKFRTFAERAIEKQKEADDNNNQAQQQPPKKQGMAITYTDGSGERKEYAGTLPLRNKCKFHRDCKSPAATNNQRTPTCYECGNQGNYRSDCPKLKNQNHENQTGGTGARKMVHALGGGEINQDLNNVEDDTNA
ncbi:hypothetical protein Tco_1136280 [Tanacetum coccineum]